MKLIAIMGVGTYYVPWTPHVIASVYFCDEIVIVNGGMDPKNPDPIEYNIPLEKVSRDISDLDVEGKVHEITDFALDDAKHKALLMTQYEANRTKPDRWYDNRGLNATLATEKANELTADMILYVQSDQPVYRNVIPIKNSIISWMFYQYEFAGDVYHLASPGPNSPYDDAAFTYFAHEKNWYFGGCAPVIEGSRRRSAYKCAHLRHANPSGITDKEKYEHIYGRLWFRYYTNEGMFGDELEERAHEEAKNHLETIWSHTIISDVQPPEVCSLGPGRYIEEVILK